MKIIVSILAGTRSCQRFLKGSWKNRILQMVFCRISEEQDPAMFFVQSWQLQDPAIEVLVRS